jgi:putative tricarboxylic transport membrane protein
MLERVVGLVVVAAAGAYLTQAMALPYGTAAKPGAGFFPILVAIFACAVGVLMTARAFLTPVPAGAPREAARDRAARGRALGTMVVLAAFCLLMPWVGYPLVAFAFVTVLLWRLGSAWRNAGVIGALTAIASYYLFGVLLDVPLPRGPW